MYIQYFSDIHLHINNISDFGKYFPKNNLSQILIVAGDWDGFNSRFRKFISYITKTWEYVILVAGNHDYYGRTIDNSNIKYKRFEKFYKNLYFLQKDEVIIDNVRFLGCTFWSRIFPIHSYVIENTINDYRNIKRKENNNTNITTVDTNNIHIEHYKWLSNKLEENNNIKTVVITHHSPLLNGTSNPKYEKMITNHAFSTNCKNLVEKCDIWIFGHTHWNVNIKIGNTCVLSNQLGYNEEECQLKFDPLKIFEI